MFEELYNTNNKILSLEFFPPKTEAKLAGVKTQMKDLSLLKPDYMTVTYGAGGGTRTFTLELVTYIKSILNIPSVSHLTCVGHSKEEIDVLVDQLTEVGVNNILALRGDLPSGVKDPKLAFQCARDLVSYLRQKANLDIAVACYPEPHKESRGEDSDLEYLKSKFDAGAEVGISQLFFDEKIYFDFVEKLRKYGIDKPIVPGIMPVSNYAQLQKFTSMCGASIPSSMVRKLESIAEKPDEVIKYGIDYAVNLSEKLLNGGAPGIHYYTLNKSTQIKPIVEGVSFFSKL